MQRYKFPATVPSIFCVSFLTVEVLFDSHPAPLSGTPNRRCRRCAAKAEPECANRSPAQCRRSPVQRPGPSLFLRRCGRPAPEPASGSKQAADRQQSGRKSATIRPQNRNRPAAQPALSRNAPEPQPHRMHGEGQREERQGTARTGKGKQAREPGNAERYAQPPCDTAPQPPLHGCRCARKPGRPLRSAGFCTIFVRNPAR